MIYRQPRAVLCETTPQKLHPKFSVPLEKPKRLRCASHPSTTPTFSKLEANVQWVQKENYWSSTSESGERALTAK